MSLFDPASLAAARSGPDLKAFGQTRPRIVDSFAGGGGASTGIEMALGLWDEREFVTLEIDGNTFVIVDVGMRMLAPRELFNAQGFAADYVIEGIWNTTDDDWSFKSFPKDVQVRCVGNSVCPPLAEALVRANCSQLMELETPGGLLNGHKWNKAPHDLQKGGPPCQP
ncbi:DNA cytosine methyltransferase [Phaeobacter sp. B1627]|uniref:DNA cytosine methyltransferase n=1 Tax=Phaeobacter sp. B1627 TaxID=2583809 RepID=UPI002106D4E9|nr:DNA cytosine methyltransferase [Phaeobacter sp. B1627]